MQTNFTLTRDDFARFQKLVTQRFKRKVSAPRSLSLVQATFCLLIGVAGAMLFGLIKQNPRLSGSLTAIAVLLVLALVTLLVATRMHTALVQRHMLLPNGAFLSPQTIRISETALFIESDQSRSELPWSSFVGLEQDEKNYYLLVDAMQAVIVPKAAIRLFRTEFESRVLLIKNSA